MFGLQCEICPEAASVISDLYKQEVTYHIVSGNSPKVVDNVANAVYIALSNITSHSVPTQK